MVISHGERWEASTLWPQTTSSLEPEHAELYRPQGEPRDRRLADVPTDLPPPPPWTLVEPTSLVQRTRVGE